MPLPTSAGSAPRSLPSDPRQAPAPLGAGPAVLQVIHEGTLRGAEVFALDLSAALRRAGWSAVLLSLCRVEASFAEAAAAAEVPLVTVAAGGRAAGFDPRVLVRVRRHIARGQFGVVQANGAATLKYLAVARLMDRESWTLVYRAIGMGSFWRRGWRGRLYRPLLWRPHRIVAVSGAVRDDLTASGVSPRRIVVIPNAVDPARLAGHPLERAAIRSRLGIGEEERVLVYAGSFSPEKQVPAVLEVVRRCRASGLPVRAILVGDGPERGVLAAGLRRDGLRQVVALLPPHPRVAPFLRAADLCLLPSRTEGMPALLIEAGLLGVPAVAYRVGGVGEVVEHGVTGTLVPPGDLSGLAAAVMTLLRDDVRRQAMGRAAVARCRQFTIDAVAGTYAALYRSLMPRGVVHPAAADGAGRSGSA